MGACMFLGIQIFVDKPRVLKYLQSVLICAQIFLKCYSIKEICFQFRCSGICSCTERKTLAYR